MPAALLDTNAVSDFMRDHPRVKARVSSCPDPIVTSVIVVGEIRYGLDRLPAGKKRNDLETRASTVLATLPATTVTPQIAEIYGRLKANLQAQGMTPDDNDLWIAATALVSNDILVSRDQFFQRVPGLQVEDWTV
ncbi:MAG TPA: type II toxin-antitoxin system VapC family toxin [Gemmataceae bacterium]|jgi:tRNA(fMet)-specific endonuclease VapC|nr:type II toxin-antitoxin system VapC family toxin [Gemmataceae bacterium]